MGLAGASLTGMVAALALAGAAVVTPGAALREMGVPPLEMGAAPGRGIGPPAWRNSAPAPNGGVAGSGNSAPALLNGAPEARNSAPERNGRGISGPTPAVLPGKALVGGQIGVPVVGKCAGLVERAGIADIGCDAADESTDPAQAVSQS